MQQKACFVLIQSKRTQALHFIHARQMWGCAGRKSVGACCTSLHTSATQTDPFPHLSQIILSWLPHCHQLLQLLHPVTAGQPSCK